MLLGFAIGFPALAVGGVPPLVVPVFLVVTAALWWTTCSRSRTNIEVPWIALVGLMVVGLTTTQWLPVSWIRPTFAPRLHEQVVWALTGTDASPPSGLSVVPAQSAFEAARLLGLTLLLIASAQLSWRVSAVIVASLGTIVTALGLAHGVAGTRALYGLYFARDAVHTNRALLGTFINANHQSGLLLLSLFSALGLAVDQWNFAQGARDPAHAERSRDRAAAGLGATVLQIVGVLMSLSRAALLALFALIPVAVGTALWSVLKARRGTRSAMQPWSWVARWLGACAVAVVFVAVARHGAIAELRTLFDTESSTTKLRMARDALPLVTLSPWLGIGRGSFIDLFGFYDPDTSHVLVTHLECAPIVMLVEWGPVPGGLLAAAALVWWVDAFVRAGGRIDAAGRRIVLLGVLALAIQNVTDFALEFLGVAAPCAALVGGLSIRRSVEWRPGPARVAGMLSLGVAGVLAVWAYPQTWSYRDTANHALLAGRVSAKTLLEQRPLDGELHLLIARDLAAQGRWTEAAERTNVATKLRPGSLDAWLLAASAADHLGKSVERDQAARQALARLHGPVPPDVARYLATLYPNPHDLAAQAPTRSRERWLWLVRGLQDIAPEHADAIAARVELDAPDDSLPVFLRSGIALAQKRPELALYHARRLRQRAPGEAASHLAVSQALGAFRPPRRDEQIDSLEQALASVELVDPGERGIVEERLVRLLLALGDPIALRRAHAVATTLPHRPAPPRLRRTRSQLLHEVEQRLERTKGPP